MELSKVQQEAVDFYEGCCNVIASAGSGKTRVLYSIFSKKRNLMDKKSQIF